MTSKSYSEMLSFATYEERLKYLKLEGIIGNDTFGFNRYLNQSFYNSTEWRRFRRSIVLRDMGSDLAIEDRPILGSIILHHINPLIESDLINRTDRLMNPENVVCVSPFTHRIIHFGSMSDIVPTEVIERKPNDTCPWK